MRKADRLFQIIQILRSRRRPTTGNALAAELEVSLRTLYRDMAELIGQRVPIRGEAGMGYVIDSDFDMPPLMLTADELEAAVVGAAWIAQRGDASLACAARDLIAKLTSAVPEALQPALLDSGLMAMTFKPIAQDEVDVSIIRLALRHSHKLDIDYRDAGDAVTTRRIWPVAMAYTEQHRVIAAWCELRNDFRHFRADRILACYKTGIKCPASISVLRKQWYETRLQCPNIQAAQPRQGEPIGEYSKPKED